MLYFYFLIGRLNRNRNFSLKIIGIGTQKSISVRPYVKYANIISITNQKYLLKYF